MKPLNRLREMAGRLLNGGGPLPAGDEAIYLTETAYRNRHPAAAKAPEIRERHFGLGSGRRRTPTPNESAPDALARPRGGLLARLWPRGTAQDGRGGVQRTKIVGTPYPASPKPLAASLAAPLPEKKAAPAFSGNDAEMLRNLFGEPEKTRQTPPLPSPLPSPSPSPLPRRATAATATATAAPRMPAAPAPAPVVKRKRKKMDRGDLTVAALGLTLAAICAIFPWYIFFNQEKFGVREFVFSGSGTSARPIGLSHIPQPVGKPFAAGEMPKLALDFFPTATLPADRAAPRAVSAAEQPFPADRLNFRLVHVANGRAMIEDGDGLWVVQRGSRLPDASRVVAIEQRQGRWVLLTSHNGIVELGAD